MPVSESTFPEHDDRATLPCAPPVEAWRSESPPAEPSEACWKRGEPAVEDHASIPAERTRRPSFGAVLAMIGAVAFGLSFAVAVAKKVLSEPEPASPVGIRVAEPDPVVHAPRVEPPPGVPGEVAGSAEGAPGSAPPAPDGPTRVAPAHVSADVSGVAQARVRGEHTAAAGGEARAAAPRDRLRMGGPSSGAVAAPDGTSRRRTRLTARRPVLTERELAPVHALLDELSAAEVSRIVRGQRARLQRCYDRALRRIGEARSARAELTVHVARTGNVAKAEVAGDDFGGLHECLGGTAARWSFPPSRNGGVVPIPLSFAPGR